MTFPLLKNRVFVADRFFNDFALLNVWDSSWIWFVVRYNENLQYCTLKENKLPDGHHEHILKDECIQLNGPKSWKGIPGNFAGWFYGMRITNRPTHSGV